MKLFVERNWVGKAVDAVFQVCFTIGVENGEIYLLKEKIGRVLTSTVNISSLVAVVDFNMKVSSVQGVTIHVLHHPNVF